MIYLGVDPSTTSTGYGVFDDDKLLDYGCIRPSRKLDWEDRLIVLSIELNNIFKKWRPVKVYEENVPLKDGKPTIQKLSNVQGVLRCLSAMYRAEFVPLKVNEWRQNAGFFDGTKKGLERETMKLKAVEEVKRIFNIEVNDDVAEGILVGYRTVYPIEKSS